MNVGVDNELISQACESVRNDKDVRWASMQYDPTDKIVNVVNTGDNYADFVNICKEDVRVYGYVKFQTGDEMSKREKFVFISWVGEKVPAVKKGQVSTHKGIVKKAIQNFAVEIQAYSLEDLNEKSIKTLLIKAGGANYGTGGR